MGFIPISINAYIKEHLKNNPSENKKELRNRINAALSDFKKRVKCSCGNDIWVVGSATVGNSCYSCITGESNPTGDYEIESAVSKGESTKDKKYIDNIPHSEMNGFFDDDGYKIDINLIKKPSLCITCLNDDDPNEEIFCQMTRHDQKDDEEFICFAYKKRSN